MTTNTPPSPTGQPTQPAQGAESARITLTLTPEQAQAVCEALDTYTRLAIGQLEVVSGLVRFGVIPQGHAGTREREQGQDNPRELASAQTCDQVEELLGSAKAALGYYRNGSNGIGHPHVHITGLRAYEALKALSQAVAIQRDPEPKFRGVNYDGLLVRYTQDPAPVAAAHLGASPAARTADPGAQSRAGITSVVRDDFSMLIPPELVASVYAARSLFEKDAASPEPLGSDAGDAESPTHRR